MLKRLLLSKPHMFFSVGLRSSNAISYADVSVATKLAQILITMNRIQVNNYRAR